MIRTFVSEYEYIPIYKSPNTWSYTILIRVMLVVLRAEYWAKKQKAKELNMAIQTAIRREIQIEQRKAAAEAARLAEAKAKRQREKEKERNRDIDRDKNKIKVQTAPVLAVKSKESSSTSILSANNVLFFVNSCTVIIRHGEYFSIYSKLRNATVTAGQKISTKQHIGNIFSSRVEGVTEMNFQIWKGATPIHPSSWIAR